MKLILIDTETTGLDPGDNGIIQIAGSILIDGEKIESFDYKMAPLPDDDIEPSALEVHGYTEDEIRSWPEPRVVKRQFDFLLSKHCDRFNKLDKFQWVGYNADFDMRFVREWFNKLADPYFGSWFWFPPLDVMSLAAWILQPHRNQLPNFKLGTVAKYFGLEPAGNLHDAMTDIDLTWRLAEVLANAPRKGVC